MKKRFNIAGTCIPQKHYMADTSEKLSRMIRLIEQESYFMFNRAHQYGKTTTLMLLWRRLKEKYVVINISFEGMGMDAFGSEDAFVRRFCGRVEKNLRLSGYSEAKQNIWKCTAGKENLKLKLRPDEERKYNSPWNIAVDFPIDMSLSVPEISSMIREYEEEQEFTIDAEDVACEIRRYTSGYPFLVSLICLWMDERVSGELSLKDCWTPRGVRAAAREILKGTNPLFDDMIKNLENNPKFRSFVEGILFHGNQIPYKVSNTEINLGVTFGIIGEKEGLCKISKKSYIQDVFVLGNNGYQYNYLQNIRGSLMETDWFQECVDKEKKGFQYILPHDVDYYETGKTPASQAISVVLPIRSGNETVGYTLCDIRMNKAAVLPESIHKDANMNAYLVNGSTKEYYDFQTKQNHTEGTAEFIRYLGDKKSDSLRADDHFIIYSKMESSDWYIAAVYLYKDIISHVCILCARDSVQLGISKKNTPLYE